jgi:hypothetical protein
MACNKDIFTLLTYRYLSVDISRPTVPAFRRHTTIFPSFKRLRFPNIVFVSEFHSKLLHAFLFSQIHSTCSTYLASAEYGGSFLSLQEPPNQRTFVTFRILPQFYDDGRLSTPQKEG